MAIRLEYPEGHPDDCPCVECHLIAVKVGDVSCRPMCPDCRQHAADIYEATHDRT